MGDQILEPLRAGHETPEVSQNEGKARPESRVPDRRKDVAVAKEPPPAEVGDIPAPQALPGEGCTVEPMDGSQLRERLMEFVRAFGLHHMDRTPCNQRMSVSEAHALSELAGHAPLSAGELAKRLRLEKSTVSRIIAQLQTRGWVERRTHAADRRITLLTLTPSGGQAESELAEARQARFEWLLERIPAEERLVVLRGLDVLIDALDAGFDDNRTVAESDEDCR